MRTMSLDALQSILARVRGGDREAWAELLPVLDPVVHLVVGRAAARFPTLRPQMFDLMQEVYVHLLHPRTLRDFAPSHEVDLTRYVYTVAQNKVMDELRKRRPQHEIEAPPESGDNAAPDTSGDPEEIAVMREQLSRIKAHLDGADPKTRAIFDDVVEKRMSLQEIAAQRGESLDAVTKRWHRLRTRLREILSEDQPGSRRSGEHG